MDNETSYEREHRGKSRWNKQWWKTAFRKPPVGDQVPPIPRRQRVLHSIDEPGYYDEYLRVTVNLQFVLPYTISPAMGFGELGELVEAMRQGTLPAVIDVDQVYMFKYDAIDWLEDRRLEATKVIDYRHDLHKWEEEGLS